MRHDSAVHSGVQIAERIRKDYPSGVQVEVFENHRGKKAYQEILRLLDANHTGTPSEAEKRDARIILYGHSWGGSEAVTVARMLEKDDIPVLLTIQIDSVRKGGEDDSVIPANVAQAANFYQTRGIIHGRREIRAADPSRTQIIGNFKFDYSGHSVKCPGYPWFARTFEKTHIEIECDPAVSSQVESMIRSKLPHPQPSKAEPRQPSE